MIPGRAAARSSARFWLLVACCAIVLGVIAAYAALLPRARWEGDEYLVFALQRELGWTFFRLWYVSWSPRLFSDVLFGLYGMAVLALHRPLAGSCMAVLWAGLAAACVVPAWRGGPGRLSRLLVGLGLFALFLVGHAATEVFYWPAGGLSYLPTLAGAVWLFWLLADGAGAQGWRQVGAAAALFVIGGSSEVGVFLALAIAGCVGPAQVGQPWRRALWLLPGVAVALVDLGLVLHARVGTIEMADGDPAVLHHARAAVLRAIPSFARDLARPAYGGGSAVSVELSLAARLLVVLGAHWSFGRMAGRRRLPVAFGVALLLAAFASGASAYYQFGRLCCGRHDTMRACLIVLALASFGAAWPYRRPAAGAACWAAAVLLLFVPAAPSVLADYRSMDRAIAARARTWQSGTAPGSAMVFEIEPPGRVLSKTGFAPGLARSGPAAAWWQSGILRFFDKQTATIVQAQ